MGFLFPVPPTSMYQFPFPFLLLCTTKNKCFYYAQRLYWYKCVRLSRLLAFECTLNHCTFIHSFIHSLLVAAICNQESIDYNIRCPVAASQKPKMTINDDNYVCFTTIQPDIRSSLIKLRTVEHRNYVTLNTNWWKGLTDSQRRQVLRAV